VYLFEVTVNYFSSIATLFEVTVNYFISIATLIRYFSHPTKVLILHIIKLRNHNSIIINKCFNLSFFCHGSLPSSLIKGQSFYDIMSVGDPTKVSTH